jgi:hypothetical protein
MCPLPAPEGMPLAVTAAPAFLVVMVMTLAAAVTTREMVKPEALIGTISVWFATLVPGLQTDLQNHRSA